MVTALKSPGLLDEVFNSLQRVIGKFHGINLGNNIINHGINLGDNIILRIHSKNYFYVTVPSSFIFFHLILFLISGYVIKNKKIV